MADFDKRGRVSDAEKIIHRIIGDDPELRAQIEEQRLNVRIAEMIYQVREAAGLTQTQLATLVGTTQSVISRLEDADYEGHSLPMLKRIGDALHQRLEVRFVPEPATKGV
ncbi:MAG: helix-turn-helix transcriptional regulator [Burkholderiales bacterium]